MEDRGFSAQPRSTRGVRGIESFWAWLHAQGIIKDNPLASVKAAKLPQRLPKPLKPEKVEAVHKGCNSARDEAIVLMLVDTGMRLSELANLRELDVDESERRLRVVRKGAKGERSTCQIGLVRCCPRASEIRNRNDWEALTTLRALSG